MQVGTQKIAIFHEYMALGSMTGGVASTISTVEYFIAPSVQGRPFIAQTATHLVYHSKYRRLCRKERNKI